MRKRKKQKGNFSMPANNKVIFLLISTICIIVYSQTLSFDLVFCDDHDLILNPEYGISDFSALPDIAFKGYIGTNYFRPIVIASFMTDYLFSGENATMYHLTNLILHILFCCLLFRLLTRLDLSRQKAFLGAVIYSVHPIFVNSVAWIVGRNDILFSIFCVLSLLWLIRYLDSAKMKYFALHLLFLLFAFLSKETALVFPLILTFYLILIRRIKSIKKLLLNYWIYWAGLILIFFLLRSAAELGENVNNYGLDVFLMNLRVIPEFLAKFLLPVKMSVLPTYGTFNTILGLVVIVLLAIFILRYGKPQSRNQILFGMIWFLILVLPAMLFTVKNSHDWNEYLDTRAYLPMVGIIYILFNLNIRKLFRINPSFVRFILIIIIVLLGWRTISVSGNYSNPLTFYQNAVEQDSSRPLFHFTLSRRYSAEKQFKQAEKYMASAANLKPNSAKYQYNLGLLYFNHQKPADSFYPLNLAINLDSNYKEAYNILGQALFWEKRNNEAISIWKIGIRMFPGFYELYDNLAYIYLVAGDIDSSLKYSNRLVGSEYNVSKLTKDYYNYALSSYNNNDTKTAVRFWEHITNLNPGYLDSYKGLFVHYLKSNDLSKAIYYAKKFVEYGGKDKSVDKFLDNQSQSRINNNRRK